MNFRRSAGLILGLFMAGAASLSAAADSFPKAPIKLVTAPHCPVPFTPTLEDLYLPGPDKIEAAVRSILGRTH